LFLICCDVSHEDSSYLRWVGDSEQRAEDGDFRLCHAENKVLQYFNPGNGLQYTGEKTAINDAFAAAYKPVAVDQNGWIRIRFIVNCNLETGRFRVIEADEMYKERPFDPRITEQLLTITKSLDGWQSVANENRSIDYYQYLVFKIKNGAIEMILP